MATIVCLSSGTMVAYGDEEVGSPTQETTESTEPPSTIPTTSTDKEELVGDESKPTIKEEEEESSSTPLVKRVGQVKGLKAKAVKTKSCTLIWRKTSNAQGYQIYKYSSKKKKYVYYKKTNKTSCKLTKLKSNTTYKYKVRGYRNNYGNTTYGKFSTVNKFKTKKIKKSQGKKIVSKAKSKLGCAYVYGASGPKRFDCSGFVYWTYKNAGVKPKKKVKRTSCQGMYASLKKYKVSSNIGKAKAGDIILYKKGSKYSHAAIAIGKGKIVHAARPGKGVCRAKATAVKHSSVAVIRIL